jgi:hypothetical protein
MNTAFEHNILLLEENERGIKVSSLFAANDFVAALDLVYTDTGLRL